MRVKQQYISLKESFSIYIVPHKLFLKYPNLPQISNFPPQSQLQKGKKAYAGSVEQSVGYYENEWPGDEFWDDENWMRKLRPIDCRGREIPR